MREDLLEEMNSFVGNLRLGDPKINRTLGNQNDLLYDAAGEPRTPRSRWIYREFSHKNPSGRDGAPISSLYIYCTLKIVKTGQLKRLTAMPSPQSSHASFMACCFQGIRRWHFGFEL